MRVLSKLGAELRHASRLSQRSLREQGLVAEAAVHLAVAKAMLKLMPFERWRGVLEREAEDTARARPTADELRELTWAVNGVGSRLPESLNCLPRALATRWMMKRRGWPCTLEIGVARDEHGGFEAHAWIEHQGSVVMGQVPNLERFVKLPEVAAAHLR